MVKINSALLIRVLKLIVAILFITSAISKLFPIWAFETQLMNLGLPGLKISQYVARFLVGIELAIGFCFLQKNRIRNTIIPITVALILLFCGHLILQIIANGGMNGNCGCFGELIPMTPLEALIKNFITIFIIGILYKKIESNPNDRRYVPIIIYLISTLFVFLFYPIYFKPKTIKPVILRDTIFIERNNYTQLPVQKKSKETDNKLIDLNIPSVQISAFHGYTLFSGDKSPIDLDNGKHLLCFMNANCDHCKDVANELYNLSKKVKLPPIRIFFLDEETEEIPAFFRTIGTTFPYVILGLEEFRDLTNMSFPSVFYMWNGNEIVSFKGNGSDKFNSQKLIKKLKY
jgi:thiol-disulfide isomerase/thioredoxin